MLPAIQPWALSLAQQLFKSFLWVWFRESKNRLSKTGKSKYLPLLSSTAGGNPQHLSQVPDPSPMIFLTDFLPFPRAKSDGRLLGPQICMMLTGSSCPKFHKINCTQDQHIHIFKRIKHKRPHQKLCQFSDCTADTQPHKELQGQVQPRINNLSFLQKVYLSLPGPTPTKHLWEFEKVWEHSGEIQALQSMSPAFYFILVFIISTIRTVGHWTKLPSQAAETPLLEMFKIQPSILHNPL